MQKRTTSKPSAGKPGSKSTSSNSSSSSGKISSSKTGQTRLWEKSNDSKSKPFKYDKKSSSSNDGKGKFQSNPKKRKSFEGNELDPEAKRRKKKEHEAAVKERRMLKPNASVVSEALRIWGEFSQKNCPKDQKHKLIDSLLEVSKGKIHEIVFRGSASRVFQSVIKEGHGGHRTAVFDELKDHVLEMAKNAYAHYLLIRMLKYCTMEQTDYLIKQFYGHVTNLMRQRDASKVIELIYSDDSIGRPIHKTCLVEEFYGNEFVTFKPTKKRTFEDILAENPTKKHVMMDFIRSKLMPIVNKADMSTLLNHTIIHLPLLKLFEYGTHAEIEAMIDSLKDNLVRIVHSKEGAKVACQCIAYGSPKVRKAIMKSMKGYVVKMAEEQHGHLVLLRLFDVIDDTVFVVKNILPEIKNSLLHLSEHPFGRYVILSLLKPKDKRYFQPQTLELLFDAMVPHKAEKKENDENGDDDGDDDAADDENEKKKSKKSKSSSTAASVVAAPALDTSSAKMVPTSRKDPQIRHLELYNGIIADLKRMCLKQSFRLIAHIYAKDILFETIVTSTATADDNEKAELYECVLRLIGEPKQQEMEVDEDEVSAKFHPLDFLREKPIPEEDITKHYLAHWTLRRFIQEEPGFGELVVERIGDRVWEYASQPFSSWIIYTLLVAPETKSKIEPVLKQHKKELVELTKDPMNKAAIAMLAHLENRTVDTSKPDEPSKSSSKKETPKKDTAPADKKSRKELLKEKEKKKKKSSPLIADESHEAQSDEE